MKRLFEFLLLISFVFNVDPATTDPGTTNPGIPNPEVAIIESGILDSEPGILNVGDPDPEPGIFNPGDPESHFLDLEPDIFNPGDPEPPTPDSGTNNPYKPKDKCKGGKMKNGKCICPKNKILSKGVCINNPLSKKCKNGEP